jgi:superfamily I DNA and/or RNA helicase
MGLKSNHFDAFFIDEAGYCWEAEIMSVLGVLHSKESSSDKIQRTVIAGDPKQLGAVVRSTLALKYGLGTSMIERLTNSEAYPYKKDLVLYPNTNGYNPTYIVKLLNCYRCHPQILKVSNESFYDNELIAAADPIKTQSMFRWEGLLNKTFPLIFHGVEGENKQENSSPSWFNTSEVEICLDYVQQLRASMKMLGFTLKDIAIITPYNKQVSKINQGLKMIGCSEVAVGSVETFQGQERKIIIISTVRSNPEFIGVDLRYNLGFVKNPKRFNVSVTRAIALMIVVGSPKVLNSDVYWSKLLWHCVDNNAYTGVKLPKRPDGTDNDDGTLSTRLIAAIESFHIDPKKNELKEMDEGINNTWKDVSDKDNDDNDDDDDDSWEFVDNNDASRLEGGALGENRFQTNY